MNTDGGDEAAAKGEATDRATRGDGDTARSGAVGTDTVAARLTVTGTVQGVGFRPFVARLAARNDLAGAVRNTDCGVVVRFEGQRAGVERAVTALQSEPPRLAQIKSVAVEWTAPTGCSTFDIRNSTDDGDRTALVPPDTALCADCLADLRDSESRFYEYWATGCVNCGPRFSVTAALPYDRDRTALSPFPPCSACRESYVNRNDRRFHAQTIACPSCGPMLSLVACDGTKLADGSGSRTATAARLKAGEIIGIKGAGGTHLACLATDTQAVSRLRERLGRPAKPFATMAPSLDRIRQFATVDEQERKLLTSKRRPIVLVRKDSKQWVSAVAPNMQTIGVMLPYSGLHHLLFEQLPAEPLVVTSANPPGEPMATTVEDLLSLDALDAALVHDREVINRCDDSVVRVVNGDRRLLRRSRGYVPRPLPRRRSLGTEVLAVGGATDVTVAATRERKVVPTQHIGDIDSPATAAFHREATDRLLSLLDVEPEVVACDMHPDLETTRLAQARPERTVRVQHHHAHAASLLAEHDCDRGVVIAADGTGYGPDGVVRGGEVLDATLTDCTRVGGLDEFPLAGGEQAVREPTRIAAALLAETEPERAAELLLERGTVDSRSIAEAVVGGRLFGEQAPPTSSAGRFLDAVAALLGVCTERRYQAEPAMRLEAVAAEGNPKQTDPPVIERAGEYVLDTERAFTALVALTGTHATPTVAATAQRLVGVGLADAALAAAADRNVETVGFTGGVAYNPAIDRYIRRRVEAAGYTYLGHDRVPPGDAGLAYGQAVVTSARLAESD